MRTRLSYRSDDEVTPLHTAIALHLGGRRGGRSSGIHWHADPEIRVRFDEPMVAVAAVGTEAMLPITIKPAIAGTWRWIDTRVAQFTSKAARATRSISRVV